MMRQTWRWFGPDDPVTLSDIRQAGAEGIVTALYDIAPGEAWPRERVTALNGLIEEGGLTFDVVESLPVSEAIRAGLPEREAHLENWCKSLRVLAEHGIKTICYNFMPVLDWTRTELAAPMKNGALALRYDLVDFAVFDCHILARENADADYTADILEDAARRFAEMDDDARDTLTATILAGLPGSVERWDLDGFRKHLERYASVDADALRRNLNYFLEGVVPEAERLGMRLCCHPDDPPWPILGLPRIMSTEADYQYLVDAVPSPANGITFCTGSLGAHHGNDLHGFVIRLGRHIHFAHLRNVLREAETVPCSFHEADHLDGSTDMVCVVSALIAEQARRRKEGREDWKIPMRPDHGQAILDDQRRQSVPGYPAIGRLKGLAELRGVMMALSGGHPAGVAN